MRYWYFLVLLAAAFVIVGAYSPRASATVFSIDNFSVTLNGSLIFDDEFDDGLIPPSGPAFINDPLRSPIYTGIRGTFIGEAGGKLSYDPAFGTLQPNCCGQIINLTRARLRTSVDSSLPTNLGPSDTFNVSAVFDLVNPGPAGEDFRISMSDSASGNTSNDAVFVGVRRADFGSGNPLNSLNGQVVIFFAKANAETDVVTFADAIPVDLTGNPDQIRLSFEKTNASNTEIAATYTYLKDGAELSETQTFSQTFSLYNGEEFTRPEFGGRQRPGNTPSFAVQLTTGSPAGISQAIDTGSSPFLVAFGYKFETTTGVLDVVVNGVSIGTISAPAILNDTFAAASFLIDNPELLNLDDIIIAIILDGPSGSSILLDNILAPNLANGDFQTGNISGWSAISSGAGGVRTVEISPVPLPAAAPLFLTAIAALAAMVWRRRNSYSVTQN